MISSTALIGIVAVLIAAGVIAWEWLGRSSATPTETDTELDAFLREMSTGANPTLPRSDNPTLEGSFYHRTLGPVVGRIGSRLAKSTNQSAVNDLQQVINSAGLASTINPGMFMVIRLSSAGVLALLGLVLGALIFGVGGGNGSVPLMWPMIVALIGLGIGFLGPIYYLRSASKKRKEAVRRSLPSALALLSVCIEAGASFSSAIQRVVSQYENPLTNELAVALAQMQMGIGPDVALTEMAVRVDVDEVRTFVQAVVAAGPLGARMGPTLRNQSAFVRAQRRAQVEERAQKAPIKMLFPTIGCILPTIFLTLLGPAILIVRDTLGH